MRIKVNLKPIEENSSITLPSTNLHLLKGYVYKALGEFGELYHNSVSNYSISDLRGGVVNKSNNTVTYENGLHFYVTTQDNEFIGRLTSGIMVNPTFGHGVKIHNFEVIEEKFYNGWNYFKTLTPIYFLKKDTKDEYVTIGNDENYSDFLKTYLLNKISIINEKQKLSLDLSDFDLNVSYDRPHKVNRRYLKLNNGKFIRRDATTCQVNIHTNKRVAELIYTLGIGQLCGSGFGNIYVAENYNKYH